MLRRKSAHTVASSLLASSTPSLTTAIATAQSYYADFLTPTPPHPPPPSLHTPLAVLATRLLSSPDPSLVSTLLWARATAESLPSPPPPSLLPLLARATLSAHSADPRAKALSSSLLAAVGDEDRVGVSFWERMALDAARKGWVDVARTALERVEQIDPARLVSPLALGSRFLTASSKADLSGILSDTAASLPDNVVLDQTPATELVRVVYGSLDLSPREAAGLVARWGPDSLGGLLRGDPSVCPLPAANVLVQSLVSRGYVQHALAVARRWRRVRGRSLSRKTLRALVAAVPSATTLAALPKTYVPSRDIKAFSVASVVMHRLAELGEWTQASLILNRLAPDEGKLRTRLLNKLILASSTTGHFVQAEAFLSQLSPQARNERTVVALIEGISSITHMSRLATIIPIVAHSGVIPGPVTESALHRMTKRIRTSANALRGRSQTRLLGAHHHVLGFQVPHPEYPERSVRIVDLLKTHPDVFTQAVVALYVDALTSAGAGVATGAATGANPNTTDTNTNTGAQ